MKKKILILYSTAGMGHKKAANALYHTFKTRDDVVVENVDVLEYANNFYKFLYLDFYIFLMSKAKWLWGIGYYLSNSKVFDSLTRWIRGLSDYLGLRELDKTIYKKNPDAIIATHFFLPSILRFLKKNKKLTAKTYTIITDYGPHSFWLSEHIDKFFVGSNFTLEKLSERGIRKEKIVASGIPTEIEFSENENIDMLKKEYKLDRAKKTIFLMNGGFGIGPMGEILLSLNSCKAPIQVITVCGHNKQVFENIDNMKETLNYPIMLFGFTDKVSEIMSISDIMVTKAGGVSTTEALNSILPMILFGSIPGQETWNEQFLLENKASEKADRISDIPVIADRILISEDAYDYYKKGIKAIRKPNAAQDIVDVILGEI